MTFRLIPNIECRTNRRHGEVNLIRFLTVHGFLGEYYVYRFTRRDTAGAFRQFGFSPDTANRAVFQRDAWPGLRTEIRAYIGV